MKLYAISDLHLDYQLNRDALNSISGCPEDWLILGGDICTTFDDLKFALNILTKRFARLLWVPGNHDLWSGIAGVRDRGDDKYMKMISICRDFGVLTPEDPYPLWKGEGESHYLVPLFLLYDYSFRPDHVPRELAVQWAGESGVLCTDEYLLDFSPYRSRSDWCHARCEYSERRMADIQNGVPLILINHFPLREDLVRLVWIPRFSIWCGTQRTETWHVRYKVSVVISGHLHIRSTKFRDDVRFEEVSLGYPKNWNQRLGIQNYLRQILPSPDADSTVFGG